MITFSFYFLFISLAALGLFFEENMPRLSRPLRLYMSIMTPLLISAAVFMLTIASHELMKGLSL